MLCTDALGETSVVVKHVQWKNVPGCVLTIMDKNKRLGKKWIWQQCVSKDKMLESVDPWGTEIRLFWFGK